ncbi:MAG: hypothetical protein WCV70_02665 [Patescibacteria group bacterium]|jgi:hypothetical protein
MDELEKLTLLLNVAGMLKKIFGEEGFTLNAALKAIDDCYPGLEGGASIELCREMLAKVIEKAPVTPTEKLIPGYEEKFLLMPAVRGILEEVAKLKIS